MYPTLLQGFRKIDTERWEFANDGFIRDQKHLLKTITRRKHSQGLDQRKSSQPKDNSAGACQEIENFGMWKEVEILKTDKNALMQELVKLRQLQETADNKLLLLSERLQGMEKNQQQMLSFLVMAMQSPGFLVQLLQPKENSWRTAEAGMNMLERGMEDDELLASDGMIVKYQPSMDETPTPPLLTPTLNPDKSTEFDPSDGMKDFFMNIDFMKVLKDENWCSSENHGPFILPDLPDDGVLEQMLFGSSFLENTIDAKLNSQAPTDPMQTESAVYEEAQAEKSLNFELLTEQMEKSQNLENESTEGGDQLEKSQNLDCLIEQMGLLVSETNHEPYNL